MQVKTHFVGIRIWKLLLAHSIILVSYTNYESRWPSHDLSHSKITWSALMVQSGLKFMYILYNYVEIITSYNHTKLQVRIMSALEIDAFTYK